MSLAKNFSTNLKKTRTRRRRSQQELAQEAHLSVSMVSMLERGRREPSFSTVEQLAAALAIRPVDLFKAA